MTKNIFRSVVLALTVFILTSATLTAQQLAFPTAEGPGKHATGGRGGDVYKVTNLKDDYSEGSLRWAINQGGPRTIVFEVSGTIDLNSTLEINRGDVTIAGQTAPGDGICVRGYSTSIGADNVIIRYLRFRMGDINKHQGDALGGRGVENVIIDHCSFSWSIDETVSLYNNSDVTFQWCMVTESLNESFHDKGPHGYGGIWGGGPDNGKAAFHHNLIAHHTSRNPRFAGFSYAGERDDKYVDFRNNVIYNWGSQSVYGGEAQNQNMVANYYKYGPATGPRDRIVEPSSPYGDWYIADNFVYGFPEITKDNWNGGVQPSEGRVDEPHDIERAVTHTAQNAYKLVLADAGTVLPGRDAIDTRIVEEVRKDTAYHGDNGIIDSQSEVGGWPELESDTPPTDSDDDGMPDEWENARGLNPDDPADRNGDPDGDGYTNLEEYLNSLVKRADYLRSPAELEGNATSSSEIELSWREQIPFEEGFTLERAEGDTTNFSEIADFAANATSYVDQGLEAETTYYYRVRAYNQETSSIYSNVVEIRTLYADGRPIEPSGPSPADSVNNTDVLPLIEWKGADGATAYDVFLGTSEDPDLVAENVNTPQYRLGEQLQENTTYYWKVNSKNQAGVTEGPVWTFTTGSYSPSLVGYWPFDFQQGGFTPDSTFAENWGYLSESLAENELIAGIEENALQFNGSGDYLYIEHLFIYEFGAKSFTLSLWVKMDTGKQDAYLISKGSFPDDDLVTGFAIYSTSEGNMVFRVGDGEDESLVEADIAPFITGEWVKLTAIRNRQQTELQLYANSERLASAPDTSWNINNGSRIYIGSKFGSGHYFTGGIDNIRLTNYALDESQVGELKTTDTEDIQVPKQYVIDVRNYPNPFNPVTTIRYTVPEEGNVILTVYDIRGKLVKTLVRNQVKQPGSYAIKFDGQGLSSGIYICRLQVDDQYTHRKMMLVQ